MSNFFHLSITCFPHSGVFCNYCSQLDYFVWIDFSDFSLQQTNMSNQYESFGGFWMI
jgi:hypothetical protein